MWHQNRIRSINYVTVEPASVLYLLLATMRRKVGMKQGRGKKLLWLTLLLILQAKLDRVWVRCVEGGAENLGQVRAWGQEYERTKVLDLIPILRGRGEGKMGIETKKGSLLLLALLWVVFSLPSAQSVLGGGRRGSMCVPWGWILWRKPLPPTPPRSIRASVSPGDLLCFTVFKIYTLLLNKYMHMYREWVQMDTEINELQKSKYWWITSQVKK